MNMCDYVYIYEKKEIRGKKSLLASRVPDLPNAPPLMRFRTRQPVTLPASVSGDLLARSDQRLWDE